MTYEKRYEVLEAAAAWMRVCEKAGIIPHAKINGRLWPLVTLGMDGKPKEYEFPLALLEGKEVWVGSELYDGNGKKFIAEEFIDGYFCEAGYSVRGYGFSTLAESCSWNPPKPKTVMVELDLDIVEHTARLRPDISPALTQACKKALEKL